MKLRSFNGRKTLTSLSPSLSFLASAFPTPLPPLLRSKTPVHPLQLPPHHHALDLVRALHNLMHPQIPNEPFNLIIVQITVPSEPLQRRIRGFTGDVGGKALGGCGAEGRDRVPCVDGFRGFTNEGARGAKLSDGVG